MGDPREVFHLVYAAGVTGISPNQMLIFLLVVSIKTATLGGSEKENRPATKVEMLGLLGFPYGMHLKHGDLEPGPRWLINSFEARLENQTFDAATAATHNLDDCQVPEQSLASHQTKPDAQLNSASSSSADQQVAAALAR